MFACFTCHIVCCLLCSKLSLWWFQFSVTFGFYVLEWWERLIMQVVTAGVLFLLVKLGASTVQRFAISSA